MIGWVKKVLGKQRNAPVVETRFSSTSSVSSHEQQQATAKATMLHQALDQYLKQNPQTGEEILTVSPRQNKLYITVGTPHGQEDASGELKQFAEETFKNLLFKHNVSHLTHLLWITTPRGSARSDNTTVQAPSKTSHSHPLSVSDKPKSTHPHPHTAKKPTEKLSLPSIKHIIAVSSAKGGVGKSTVSVQLALALKQQGKRVGLLDADIYGPSIHHMMGIHERAMMKEKRISPIVSHGLKVMSIGCMIDPEAPMIWRGPMVMGAFEQMLRDVEWGELDVLVIDMPPGTGDVQLTLAQRVPVTGAVIVSTPQDLALIDVKRGIAMFEKVNIPMLGIIENMSYFICSTCNTMHHPFGQHGAKMVAEVKHVPFLGSVPLVLGLREAGDDGKPFMVHHDDTDPTAKSFHTIAQHLMDNIQHVKAA